MRFPSLLRIVLFVALHHFSGAAERAKNVILFLGDAGGIPTLNAASLYAHDKAQALFIQNMPHIGLSDTSSLDAWVTDSAAGMTAIVTGRKTNNGMVSILPNENGRPLKTILEYAEEKGLSTGVVTNMPVWDATPAACYAHAVSRKSVAEIFSQVFAPRFGDGVDVLIGADRKNLFDAVGSAGKDAGEELKKRGYVFFETPSALTSDSSRAVSVYDGGDFTPAPVIDTVLEILSRNAKGFFLMVEWDMHTNHLKKGLDRAIVMDELIRHVAGRVGPETLIIYAADHSFDLRLRGGRKDSAMAPQILANADLPPPPPPAKPVISVENSHTGEDIVVAAQGPGAERVQGFMPNTRIFEIMMAAYGWEESK
jgi:alkaline phosphatase